MASYAGDGGRSQVKYSARYKALIDGELAVEDLDTEELAKGRLKDKDGKFRGRPPNFLPRKLVEAMRSEHHRRINAALEESLSDTVRTMRGIMRDPEADPSTRLKAAIYVYERFMGKTPDRIEVNRGDKVEQVVERIMYDMGESPIEREIAATEEELDRPAQRKRRSAARTQTNRMNG